mmetsp:Transcript_41840/g.100850  ORF Transcript_41840/g.100850 Transcript_41840/m.100850 type:complete len:158 (-) Transcript_41840:278-751(-)
MVMVLHIVQLWTVVVCNLEGVSDIPGEPNCADETATMTLSTTDFGQSNQYTGWNDVRPTSLYFGFYEKPLSSSCKEQAYCIAPSMRYTEHVANAAAIGMSLAKVKNQDDHNCMVEVSLVLGAGGTYYLHLEASDPVGPSNIKALRLRTGVGGDLWYK